MRIDGAWWMAAPFAALLLIGLYLLRRRPLMGIGFLVMLMMPFALEAFRNWRSVAAARVEGHLRPDDPTVLIAVNVRETPEFYATLLYGGGFSTLYLYQLPKSRPPEYPFDNPAASPVVQGIRIEKTRAPGCEAYTLDNFAQTRKRSSAETSKCLSRSEVQFSPAQIAANAILYTQGATRFDPAVRVSGSRYEIRRRKNNTDDLVAFHLATGADFESMSFLAKALTRK